MQVKSSGLISRFYRAVRNNKNLVIKCQTNMPISTHSCINRILCAAIWCPGGSTGDARPVNIDTGYVVAGRRHSDCYCTLLRIESTIGFEVIEGFLTADNRFVDRKEAYAIALGAGQILHPCEGKIEELISENLYWGNDILQKGEVDGS